MGGDTRNWYHKVVGTMIPALCGVEGSKSFELSLGVVALSHSSWLPLREDTALLTGAFCSWQVEKIIFLFHNLLSPLGSGEKVKPESLECPALEHDDTSSHTIVSLIMPLSY